MNKEPTEATSAAGTRIKSPQYPYSTIKESIEDAETIYSKDKNLVILQEAAARHLGYAGLNGGLAARRLSALKQYGLAEFPQAGKIKLSNLFTKWKFAKDEKEKLEALNESLASPPIFKEVFEAFGGIENIPSDPSLKSFLIREKNFNPDIVDRFIKTFRGSVQHVIERNALFGDQFAPLATEDRSGYLPSGGGTGHQIAAASTHRAGASGRVSHLSPAVDFDQIAIRLPGDRRAVLFLPMEFYDEDKEFIRRQLDIIWSHSMPASTQDEQPAETSDEYLPKSS